MRQWLTVAAGLRPAVTLSHDGASKPKRINSSRAAPAAATMESSCVPVPRLGACFGSSGGCLPSSTSVLRFFGQETHHDGPRILLSSQDAPPATGNSARLQHSGAAESTHFEDLRHSRSAQTTGHASQRPLPIATEHMPDVPKAYPTESRLPLPQAMRCLPATQSPLVLTFELPLAGT